MKKTYFISWAILFILMISPAVSTALQGGIFSYKHPEADFTFDYPESWEVVYEGHYETAAGVRAEKWSVELKPVGNDDPNDTIRINARQFSCAQGRCEEMDGNIIGTYSRNPGVTAVFDMVVKSFKIKSQ
jgi:hypothetical protein